MIPGGLCPGLSPGGWASPPLPPLPPRPGGAPYPGGDWVGTAHRSRALRPGPLATSSPSRGLHRLLAPSPGLHRSQSSPHRPGFPGFPERAFIPELQPSGAASLKLPLAHEGSGVLHPLIPLFNIDYYSIVFKLLSHSMIHSHSMIASLQKGRNRAKKGYHRGETVSSHGPSRIPQDGAHKVGLIG